jgi:hypothetical protein
LKLHEELAGIIAAMLCVIVLYALGWVALVDGGISLPSRLGSRSFVGGTFGVVVGASFFFFAFCFTLMLVKILRLPRLIIGVLAVLVFVPPLAFFFYK